jgi:hypothetical protein
MKRGSQTPTATRPNGGCPRCHVGPLFHSIHGVRCLHCSHQVMDAARFAGQIARREAWKEARRRQIEAIEHEREERPRQSARE